MVNTFLINQNTKFVLYGAAFAGGVCYEKLSECGYTVLGFIDRRASEIGSYMGLPVWNPQSIPAKLKSDSTVVLIISVKNVFEHSQIAQTLIKMGFERLIYKPYSVLLGYENRKTGSINKAYEAIYCKQLNAIEEISYAEAAEEREMNNPFLKEIDALEIVTYVPAENIFTNEGTGKWSDINIRAMFTHANLFAYLAGDANAQIEPYIEEYCVPSAKEHKVALTDEWKRGVLYNRAFIYEEMCRTLETDAEFFQRNAAAVKWNDVKNHFNLLGGKFRTTFLVSKGYEFIPLKMSKADYDKWINNGVAKRVNEILIERCVHLLSEPINHPYFFRIPGIRDGLYRTVLQKLVTMLSVESFQRYGKVTFNNINVLDVAHGIKALSRTLAKLGCTVVRIQEEEDELINSIDALEYATCEITRNDKSLEKYQLCIIDDKDGIQAVNNFILNHSNINRFLLISAENNWIGKGLPDNWQIELWTSTITSDSYRYAYFVDREEGGK